MAQRRAKKAKGKSKTRRSRGRATARTTPRRRTTAGRRKSHRQGATAAGTAAARRIRDLETDIRRLRARIADLEAQLAERPSVPLAEEPGERTLPLDL